MLKSWRLFIALTAAALLAACGRSVKTATERRESFEPLAATRMGGLPAREFLERRYGIVVGGASDILIERDRTKPEKWTYAAVAGTGRGGTGSAAAIDRRGYFLTASHVVTAGNPDKYSVIYFDGTTLRAAKAEVVWHTEYKLGGPIADLGLLWIPANLENVFEWSPSVAPGEDIIGVGPAGPMAIRSFSAARPSKAVTLWGPELIAGKMSARLRQAGAPAWERIEHDAPGRKGDSGGPMVNLMGQLIGIESGGRGRRTLIAPMTITGLAVRPADIDEIRAIIEKHYASKNRSAN